MNNQDLLSLSETIQDDIITVMDGFSSELIFSDELIDILNQIVVDAVNKYKQPADNNMFCKITRWEETLLYIYIPESYNMALNMVLELISNPEGFEQSNKFAAAIVSYYKENSTHNILNYTGNSDESITFTLKE